MFVSILVKCYDTSTGVRTVFEVINRGSIFNVCQYFSKMLDKRNCFSPEENFRTLGLTPKNLGTRMWQ